jgi:hypothetical protein
MRRLELDMWQAVSILDQIAATIADGSGCSYDIGLCKIYKPSDMILIKYGIHIYTVSIDSAPR